MAWPRRSRSGDRPGGTAFAATLVIVTLAIFAGRELVVLLMNRQSYMLDAVHHQMSATQRQQQPVLVPPRHHIKMTYSTETNAGRDRPSVSVALSSRTSTQREQCMPAKAACSLLLDSGHPGCNPPRVVVEGQAAYFMQNWLAEFRNGRDTDVLAPGAVFSEELKHISLMPLKRGCRELQEHMLNMGRIITEMRDECSILDVGANIGTYADWLLDNTPQHCHIFSYEPVPPTWKTLQKRHEKHARVHTYNKAVSNSTGFTSIAFGKPGDRGAKLGGRSDATSSAEVQVVTLDSEIAHLGGSGRIPFVKVDVESLELSVLRGLSDTLRERRVRSILWERNPEQHQCSCGQKDEAGRCACIPLNSMRSEVEYVASFGYHVFLPGTTYFLRIDGKYWHNNYEVDIYTHIGRKSPVINLLAVAPGDPILAYIAETRTMLEVPGVFQF